VPHADATPTNLFFDPAELPDADAGHQLIRQYGAWVEIRADYDPEQWPEIGLVHEAGWPDVAWLFYRATDGLYLDDLRGNLRHRPHTMRDLMATIVATLRATVEAAVDAIPATLLPPLPVAFRCAD